MLKNLTLITFFSLVLANEVNAQTQKESQIISSGEAVPPTAAAPKKANRRTAGSTGKDSAAERFERASVETMRAQCVKLETGAGIIELEMFPESAPESVRNFLNLAASGAFDTTKFNRVVPGFVVQGGNLGTREKLTPELFKRAQRAVPDEPSLIKHERGILSMARTDAPNSATTNFFILVREARHLDGTFAAFGRVTSGMEVVDAINKMPVDGDKPTKPVRLDRAVVAPCPVRTEP